jgi:ABC-2 type transport system permease protein
MQQVIKNVFTQKNYNLLSEMVRTDFKLRYQGSALGYLWSLLKPLMLFGVLYAVFTQFLRFGGEPTSLLLGIVLWSFFVEATTISLSSIVDRGDLIRKIKLPNYLIVLSATFSALINLLLNLVVVFVFVAIFGGNVTWTTPIILPLLIIELYIFALAASFVLATMYVKFRDMNYIWEVLIQLLFFVTPILYPMSFIDNENFQKLLALSPLTQVIQGSRDALTAQDVTSLDVLGWPLVMVPPAIVAFSVFVAVKYFKSQSKDFAENV